MKDTNYRLAFPEKQAVIRHLAEKLQSLKEVAFAYLYGSFIEDMPFHDVDVGIYLSGISEAEAGILAVELASILTKSVELEVDVRVLNFAPVSFVYHVICGQVLFERSPDARIQIIENVVRQYLDMKPLLCRAMKEAFTR
jgi:predicted nucleotidyltransferase